MSTKRIDPEVEEMQAEPIEHDQVSWKLDGLGGGLARMDYLTLRFFTIVGRSDGHKYVWEIYDGEFTPDPMAAAENHLMMSSDDVEEKPETALAARIAAENAARAWFNGEGNRFGDGDQLQVPAWWLVKHLELEDAIANNGGWGDVPTDAMLLIHRGPDCDDLEGVLSPWVCATEIAGFELAPQNDAEAAKLFDAWNKYQAFQGAAKASAEALEEHTKIKNAALDAMRAASGEPPAEPLDLDVPDRTPDEVRAEKRMAIVEFNSEELHDLGEQLSSKVLQVKAERDAAREAARAARETLAALMQDAQDLAAKHRRRGEKKEVSHRVEIYRAEDVVVVRREDTGEVVDTRRMMPRERQAELQLDSDEASTEEEKPEVPAEPAPFEIETGMELASIDSGKRMQVIEYCPPGAEGSDGTVTLQKLTKAGKLDGRGKPSNVSTAALFKAYRPRDVPARPVSDDA